MRCDRSVPGKITFGTGNDWLELGGSGMVHRKVLENCGIDSGRYQGFAFGFGLDRMAALLCGTTQIRDVIAFPKTQKCQDLMAQSPTPVTAKQLKELHIAIVQPE